MIYALKSFVRNNSVRNARRVHFIILHAAHYLMPSLPMTHLTVFAAVCHLVTTAATHELLPGESTVPTSPWSTCMRVTMRCTPMIMGACLAPMRVTMAGLRRALRLAVVAVARHPSVRMAVTWLRSFAMRMAVACMWFVMRVAMVAVTRRSTMRVAVACMWRVMRVAMAAVTRRSPMRVTVAWTCAALRVRVPHLTSEQAVKVLALLAQGKWQRDGLSRQLLLVGPRKHLQQLGGLWVELGLRAVRETLRAQAHRHQRAHT
mmetsp:Transcript_46824/g.87221  ORF Transcript_46824/g.87221 Transcript_46824/m.87221 type:complete len:261 (-) Transcript_46824:112-894(-)